MGYQVPNGRWGWALAILPALLVVGACENVVSPVGSDPAARWDGDGLVVLDPNTDPDGASLQIAVENLVVGVSSSVRIGVENAGMSDLRLGEIAVPPEVTVTLPAVVQPAARAEVAIRLTAAEPGEVRSLVDLSTNDPAYARLRIRLVGVALSVDDPGTDDPEDPGIEDPGTDDPGTDDPGTEDPDDPGTDPDDPGTEDPGTEVPDDPPSCGDRTDTLYAKRRIDVLWVMDNSEAVPQYYIKTKLSAFLSTAGGVDYQIGVTTTGLTPLNASTCPGGASGGENGRLFPVDGSSPRIITSAMPQAQQEAAWLVNVVVGDCHSDEQPYEAARRALSPPLVDHADDPRTGTPDDGNLGFLRSDADLAIVFVTDERDHANEIPGNTWSPSDYVSFFQSLKPGAPDKVKLHAIAGPRSGTQDLCGNEYADRLLDGVDATGGAWMELCSTYTPALWAAKFDTFSRGVFGHLGRTYRLSGPAEDRDGNGRVDERDIGVYVDGRLVSSRQGGARAWTYDAARNAIVFEPLYRPADGSRIDIDFTVPCDPSGSP